MDILLSICEAIHEGGDYGYIEEPVAKLVECVHVFSVPIVFLTDF